MLRASRSLGWVTDSYKLNTSKVDYEMARKLYRNEHDDYKLGAWAAKPVVNTLAGFMGAPRFIHKARQDEVQQVLDDGINEWDTRFLDLNRDAALDGDAYARIELRANRFDDNDVDFDLTQIPPEWVVMTDFDVLTGNLKEIVIKYPVEKQRRYGTHVVSEGTYHIIEILTPEGRELTVDGNAPEEVRRLIEARGVEESEDANWGFVPVVAIKNDGRRQDKYGMSELEPIEPFMKAYHDTFLFALQGAKSVVRPKVQFSIADVKKFLVDNFSEDEIREGRLSYMDKELFIMQRDSNGQDQVEFITADTGLTGTDTMLKLLFYCIVDISQTPEFAFGTAVASSKASVSEQMPVFVRNIRRMRGQRKDAYCEIASMNLAMHAQVGMRRPETYRVDLEWEEANPKDDSEVAQTLEQFIGAMVIGVDGGVLSLDAAVEFLGEHVPTLLPFTTEGNDEDERTRIITTAQLRQRLEALEYGTPEPAPPHLRPVPESAGTGGAQ